MTRIAGDASTYSGNTCATRVNDKYLMQLKQEHNLSEHRGLHVREELYFVLPHALGAMTRVSMLFAHRSHTSMLPSESGRRLNTAGLRSEPPTRKPTSNEIGEPLGLSPIHFPRDF